MDKKSSSKASTLASKVLRTKDYIPTRKEALLLAGSVLAQATRLKAISRLTAKL